LSFFVFLIVSIVFLKKIGTKFRICSKKDDRALPICVYSIVTEEQMNVQ